MLPYKIDITKSNPESLLVSIEILSVSRNYLLNKINSWDKDRMTLSTYIKREIEDDYFYKIREETGNWVSVNARFSAAALADLSDVLVKAYS